MQIEMREVRFRDLSVTSPGYPTKSTVVTASDSRNQNFDGQRDMEREWTFTSFGCVRTYTGVDRKFAHRREVAERALELPVVRNGLQEGILSIFKQYARRNCLVHDVDGKEVARKCNTLKQVRVVGQRAQHSVVFPSSLCLTDNVSTQLY